MLLSFVIRFLPLSTIPTIEILQLISYWISCHHDGFDMWFFLFFSICSYLCQTNSVLLIYSEWMEVEHTISIYNSDHISELINLDWMKLSNDWMEFVRVIVIIKNKKMGRRDGIIGYLSGEEKISGSSKFFYYCNNKIWKNLL